MPHYLTNSNVPINDELHGPWSHTFEHLKFGQDFSGVTKQIKGPVGDYLRSLPRLRHEEISLLYTFLILRDLEKQGDIEKAEHFFLPVAALINRRLVEGKRKEAVERDLDALFADLGLEGGKEFHRLLRPVISGPFDVDRMDYIQRDGRNSGVLIGGIEWPRVVAKLLPCLASHSNDKDEPTDVVLVSHVKNQHVLDDFIFSLFQMYAQVYLHPKIVAFEEVISQHLESAPSVADFKVNLDVHRSLTDENFRALLASRFGLKKIDQFLLRHPDAKVEVANFSQHSGLKDRLLANHFQLIENLDRPMIKDSVGLFLYSSIKSGEGFVQPWANVSPIAKHFYNINYSPEIWVRTQK